MVFADPYSILQKSNDPSIQLMIQNFSDPIPINKYGAYLGLDPTSPYWIRV